MHVNAFLIFPTFGFLFFVNRGLVRLQRKNKLEKNGKFKQNLFCPGNLISGGSLFKTIP